MWRLPLLLLAAAASTQQPGSMGFPNYGDAFVDAQARLSKIRGAKK